MGHLSTFHIMSFPEAQEVLVFEYQSVIQNETAIVSLIFIPDQECLHSLWENIVIFRTWLM